MWNVKGTAKGTWNFGIYSFRKDPVDIILHFMRIMVNDSYGIQFAEEEDIDKKMNNTKAPGHWNLTYIGSNITK